MNTLLICCPKCDNGFIHFLNGINYSFKVRSGDGDIIKIFDKETFDGLIRTQFAKDMNLLYSKHMFFCPKCDELFHQFFEIKTDSLWE